MRGFILKLLIISGVFVTIIYVVDLLIEDGLKKTSYREISKWNEVISGGIDADILIVGSSRALVHFDPKLIEEKTGMSCYNLGLDGSKYESQDKVLDLYLAHNKKPKILIWSLDLGSFAPIEGVYRYEQFLPFFEEREVKSILKLNQDQNQDYFNIPIAKYSNNPSLKYRGLLKQFGIKVSEPNLYKGYRKSNLAWDGKFDEFVVKKTGTHYENFDARIFNDFVTSCQKIKKLNIDIRWIVTPYYYKAIDLINNQLQIRDSIAVSADSLNISFSDMANSDISRNKGLFYNGSHMNRNGIVSFNKEINISK